MTQCFLSYRRDDNDQFGGVVDQLKRDLEGIYEAHTGRRLQIFVDRDSIGWGADWRQNIRLSVERATVFIPVITMRYFASQACRDELLAFYASARQLGVTELLLPLVLAGEDQISADDPREEVRLIERLNQKRIRPAWMAGYHSAEWRTLIVDLVTSLEHALRASEEALIARERAPNSAGRASVNTDVRQGAGNMAAQPPDVDVSDMAERLGRLTPLLEEVMSVIEDFGRVAERTIGQTDFATLSARQQKAKLLRAANEFGPVSQAVGTKGAELLSATQDADAMLRAVYEELASIDSPLARQSLSELIDSIGAPSAELAEAAGTMDELANMLRLASLMSVALRQALRPGIHGIEAIRSAVDTVQSWERLSGTA